MSCSKYRWTEECDTHICVGDCDFCDYNAEDEYETLKPKYCPFCGGENIEMFTDRKCYEKVMKDGDGKSAIGIYCKDCDCQLWDFTYTVKDYWERRNLLVKKWNTRAYKISAESLK